MPFPILLIILAGAAIAGVAAWDYLRELVVDDLLPWVDETWPELAPKVRQAFAAVDNAVVSVRRVVKAAWTALRGALLKLTVDIERRTANEYVRRVTSWLRVKLEPTKVARRVEEEVVDFDDLPSDVREQLLRDASARTSVDVNASRDRVLAVLEV